MHVHVCTGERMGQKGRAFISWEQSLAHCSRTPRKHCILGVPLYFMVLSFPPEIIPRLFSKDIALL